MARPKKQEAEKAPKNEEDEVLDSLRKGLKDCIEAEETERAKMQDDLRFAALDQWPTEIRKDREGDLENGPRPCLVIDKVGQYVTQVVNDMRQGKPGINVRPQDDNADIETAKVLKGLIRNIEDRSNADIAYATAGENAVKIGLGFFRITTEYVSDDSFDQEIRILPVPNTFSAYLGEHVMPDGSDAERGYVAESMPIEKFKTLFPGKKCSHADFEGLDKLDLGYWLTQETITVVEEYRIERQAQELYFLADGSTMSAADYEKWPAEAGPRPEVQDKRMGFKRQLKWRKATGVEVLEQRDLPGKYIPIVEVIGRETRIDGKRCLWGLVRPAKDSLRMYNYWASTITEKMGLAPKTPFIGAKGQFEGVEDRWKTANRKNHSYLEYKSISDETGNALPAPQRQPATPMEAAYFHFMQVIEHDVQTSLGMFKAAVGETESQQSGRAILALQRESDTGTYHFGANLGNSIRHAGRIIVDMIPHYYDTKRVVRILGEDGEVQTAQIDPDQQEAHRKVQGPNGAIKSIYNPGVGQYDVSITVGPSYNTKRMEAAATFVELAKGSNDPASAAVLRYLTIRNSDFNGSDEAAKMMKALLPPQVAAVVGDKDPIPKLTAQLAQMQQGMQQMQEAGQKLQEENMQLKAGTQVAAMKTQADRDSKLKALDLDRAAAQAKATLDKEVAEAEIRLKTWVAQQEAVIAEREQQLEEQKLVFEQRCRERDDAHKLQQEQMKREEKSAAEAESAMPQFVQALGQITQTFAKSQESMSQALLAVAESIGKPKTVTLGGIKRSGNGDISGASATVQ